MAQDGSSTANQQNLSPTFKLRPIKQVLNRLRHDPKYEVQDYVIGYIDRQAGVVEKPADDWGDGEDESTVVHFRYVPEDRVVWDRVRKIDLIFHPAPEETAGGSSL